MSDIYLSITETPAVVTLSQPVISGALSSTVTVANTVTVALDANSLSALENVTVTVGAAVSVSNFPATQTIAGTVTAILGLSPQYDDTGDNLKVGLTAVMGNDPATWLRTNGGNVPISGTVTVGNTVTIGSLPNTLSIVNSSSVTKADVQFVALAGTDNVSDGAPSYTMRPVRIGTNGQVNIDAVVNGESAFSSDGQSHIFAKLTPSSSVTIGSLPAISGTVTVGNSVTVAGTVTANGRSDIFDASNDNYLYRSAPHVEIFGGEFQPVGFNNPLPISGTVTVGNTVTIGSLPAISGTVTVGNSVTIGSLPAISGTVTANVQGKSQSGTIYDLPVGYREDVGSGSVSVVVPVYPVGGTSGLPFSAANPIEARATVTVSSLPASTVTVSSLPAISGTVTVGAVPNGSLTTRFGTPTTANTAFATSAVTNASRKYLLVQNVTTGGNVITVGIGFTPTTTQGIQLSAGAGITFESSYIPTGAVYVLSSVTASNFCVLEA